MVKDYKLIDCFCGAGGLSHGFSMAGFTPVFAFDNDPACIETYNNNIGSHGHVLDAKKVNRKLIENLTSINLDDITVIAGGPPCQGFSVQRRGSDHDDRNTLVLDFIRLVLEIKPKFFIMENVGGLLSKRGKPYIEEIITNCEKNNYRIRIEKLNAISFGVPQNRKRVFIIGQKIIKGQPNCEVDFSKIKETNLGFKTVFEAIKDLQHVEIGSIPNHIADKLSKINIDRISSIKEGQGRESLPEHLQLTCHNKNNNHRHLDVYGRMAWHSPSPTITARFDSFSRGRFGHPELNRTITLREGARLQSFPDTFVFYGSKVQIAKQIGNAVPPLLAKSVAENLKKYL